MSREADDDDSDATDGGTDAQGTDHGPDEEARREERLDEAIAAYLEALGAGKPPGRAEFLARYPDLVRELETFLDDQEYMNRLAESRQAGPPAMAAGRGTPSPTSPRPFGDYELLEEIDCGGMGVVYKARQRSLQRIVALKMILSGRMASATDLQRFRFEAEAIAGLDHPNIVPLYEYGEHEGQCYFSMKHVEGGGLDRHLDYLKADPRAAARLIQLVALALDYAHSRGVLHRDLKPSNILVDLEGRPYLSDFGLAKRRDAAGAVSLTNEGTLLGSPSYMAPEQATGKKGAVTTASDIYSLGAILYEILTGRAPFRAGSVVETLEQVIHQEPERPKCINPRIPRDLETICLKCIEKDPGARYASAAELAEDLRRYLAEEPIRARPSGMWRRAAKWGRRRPAQAAVLASIAIAAGIVLALSWTYRVRLRLASEREQSHIEHAKAQELLAKRYQYASRMRQAFNAWERGEADQAVALLVSLNAAEGQEDIRSFEWHYLWRLCHPERFSLAAHPGRIVSCAVFSPVSDLLATGGQDGVIRLWEAVTGKESARLSAGPHEVCALAFAPAGKGLFSVSSDGVVRRWNLATGEISWTLSTGHTAPIRVLSVSAQGDLLATGGDDGRVEVWDARSGEALKVIAERGPPVRGLRFLPGGEVVVKAGGDGTLESWEWATGKRLVSRRGREGSILSAAISQDGASLAAAGEDKTLRLWEVASMRERGAFQGPADPVLGMAFSSDAELLAIAGSDRVIRLVDAETGAEVRSLRGHGASVRCVAFSPSRRWLASGADDGTVKIWDLTVTANPLRLEGESGRITDLALAQGAMALTALGGDLVMGRWPFYLERQGHPIGLRQRLDLDPRGGTAGALSPDGALVAVGKAGGEIVVGFLSRQPEDLRLLDVVSLRGHAGRIEKLEFSPDSKALLSVGEDGTARVWGPQATGKQVGRQWAERARVGIGSHDIVDLAMSSDGELMALAWGEPSVLGVWQAASGREVASVRGPWKPVTALQFQADGGGVVTGHQSGLIRLWDLSQVAGGVQQLASFEAHDGAVGALALSPDGKVLATGGEDRRVKLWGLVTLELRATLEGHQGGVADLVFSPDTRTLISAGGGPEARGEILLWRGAGESRPDGR